MFEATVAAGQSGAWTATVTATLEDSESEEPLVATTGWASQPDQKELRSVQVDHTFLEAVANITGGRTLAISELDRFVDSLPEGHAPLVEVWSWPIWHSWWIFIAAVACFVTDWTLRRRRGLP
jgi:hypothetical protein